MGYSGHSRALPIENSKNCFRRVHPRQPAHRPVKNPCAEQRSKYRPQPRRYLRVFTNPMRVSQPYAPGHQTRHPRQAHHHWQLFAQPRQCDWRQLLPPSQRLPQKHCVQGGADRICNSKRALLQSVPKLKNHRQRQNQVQHQTRDTDFHRRPYLTQRIKRAHQNQH